MNSPCLVPTLDEPVTLPELAAQLWRPAVQHLRRAAMDGQQTGTTVLLVDESASRASGSDTPLTDSLIPAQEAGSHWTGYP
jgi:hypothetical protein